MSKPSDKQPDKQSDKPSDGLTLHGFIRSRPHLSVAALVGVAAALLLPGDGGRLTSVLIGWNAAVWLYLVTMAWLMMRAGHDRVREIAEQQDRSAPVVLTILLVAAIASMTAVLFELAQARALPLELRLAHYLFTGATVIGAWLLVGTLFTFHYAHLYYRADAQARPLAFPDQEDKPTYWDFLYFSFTIAVAVQTSDVTVVTRAARKMVLGQSVLSFFFNAAILGLSINIAASLVGT